MLYIGMLRHPILESYRLTGFRFNMQRYGSGWGRGIIGGCPTGRGVAQGYNGLELSILLCCGRIREVICKRGDTMEDAVFWGHYRDSNGFVA